MTLMRWNPIKDIMAIQEEMNKLFDETLDKFSEGAIQERIWEPLVDIYEENDKFVIKAEVPDVDKKDIEITVEDNVLTIKGEKKLEKEEKKENYLRAERFYGSFRRSFTLPTTVDKEKIKAHLDKGVLTIEIPKKEETKPKKIAIDVK